MATPLATSTPATIHDELKVVAATGQRCTLVYRTQPDSPPITYQGLLAGLITRDNVEYLRLEDGFELPLGNLLALNEKELRPAA